MLPQHDPLFMQAPADHEGGSGGRKKRKKNSPVLPDQIATLCMVNII